MGMPSVPYAWAPSTMLFPSPSKALIPNFYLLYEKIWVLWIRAVWGCFGLFLGPLGRYMGVSWVGQPLPRSRPSFRTLYYKIWNFYLKNFGFYGLGLFWAILGLFWPVFRTLRAAYEGVLGRLASTMQPRSLSEAFIQNLKLLSQKP